MADVTEETQVSGAETAEEPQEPQQTAEAEPVEAESPDQTQVEPEETEVKSERGQKRIQQLANERNNLKKEVQTFRQTIAPEESKADSQEQLPPWMNSRQNIELGSEVTPEEYQQHIAAQADQIVGLRMQQFEQKQKIKDNLEKDISYLEKEYPELQGDIKDKLLLSAIDKAKNNYQEVAKNNPLVRLKDFIEPLMTVRKGGEQVGRELASTKLSEQETNSAIKPSTESSHSQSSEEELMEMMAQGKISAKEAAEKFPNLLPRSSD